MKDTITLTTGIRTHKDGNYEGYILCARNRKFLWSQDSEIMRPDKNDAYQDAINLKKDCEEYNLLVKA